MTYIDQVHAQVIKAPKKWLQENENLTVKLSTKEQSEFDKVYSEKLKQLNNQVKSSSQRSLFEQLLDDNSDEPDSCEEVGPDFLIEEDSGVQGCSSNQVIDANDVPGLSTFQMPDVVAAKDVKKLQKLEQS